MKKLLIALATTVALVAALPSAHARNPEAAAVNDYCYGISDTTATAIECIFGYWDKSLPVVVCEVQANMRKLKGTTRDRYVNKCLGQEEIGD